MTTRRPSAGALLALLLGPLLAGALLAPAANAQMQDMPGMAHGADAAGARSASSRAYQAAMAKMHAGMDVPYTGNADTDFVAGMIPHHQGAVDMAKVELQYGHDPAMRQLALRIIAAQNREIALMTQWQKDHGPHSGPH